MKKSGLAFIAANSFFAGMQLQAFTTTHAGSAMWLGSLNLLVGALWFVWLWRMPVVTR